MDEQATEPEKRLAEAVHLARSQRGMSLVEASLAARISKNTWRRVEAGERTRDLIYPKIETALSWTSGTCATIMRGDLFDYSSLLSDLPGQLGTQAPAPTLTEADLRQAIIGALVDTTDKLTVAEIREVANAATKELTRRGLAK